jgi:general secretion pathway protein D
VYAATSSLIVTDRANNVRRMEELAHALDVPQAGDRLYTLATHGQTATELAATMEKVLQGGRRGAPDPKAPGSTGSALGDGVTAVVPVDSAHLIVVVGSDAGFLRVSALAARIDPLGPEDGGSQMHVLYLANTNAEDMVKTLSSVGLSARIGSSSTPGARPGAPPLPSSPSSPSGSALPLVGEVRIGADAATNAIIVFAGAADFAMVRDLVTKLDLPRRQVYVEAVILDVNVDHERDLGIAWHGFKSNDGLVTGYAAGGQSSSMSTLLPATLSSAAGGGGLLAGIIGQSFNVAGQSFPGFGVSLLALETNKDVNVISRPHLLTMDNNKAELSVGQMIPFPQQSLTAAVTGIPSQQISYAPRQVALTLDLTPHLNDSDSVRLEIEGTIEDVPDASKETANTGGPTTDKRTIKTAIVVRDGESVVLGGLQKETQTETVSKIPFLGDIPLLGKLFQSKSKKKAKQDLLMVLTPYVIRSPDDLRRIFERKELERREFIERYTAFQDESAYDPHVDYRRKRGLLQEINRVAIDAEHEAAAVRAAERALKKAARPDGAIDAPRS